MQWHYGARPWNPKTLSQNVTGAWAVHVAKAGRYRIELRRTPRPMDEPLGAIEAQLKIGDVDISKPMDAHDPSVVFETTLKAGNAKLETFLKPENGGKTFSAFFAYVERL